MTLPARIIVFLLMAGFVAIRARHRGGYVAAERSGRALRRERLLTSGVTLGTFLPFLAYMLGLLDGLALSAPSWVQGVGVAVGVGGLVLLARTHAALGRNFSPVLDLRSEHTLIEAGPYRFVRHPMYTSGFLLFGGLGLVALNPALGGPPLLALGLLVLLRLPDEEAMMAERFGDAWRAYAGRTGRLLPRLLPPSDAR